MRDILLKILPLLMLWPSLAWAPYAPPPSSPTNGGSVVEIESPFELVRCGYRGLVWMPGNDITVEQYMKNKFGDFAEIKRVRYVFDGHGWCESIIIEYKKK